MTKQLATKVVYKNPWMTVREDAVEFPQGRHENNPTLDGVAVAKAELQEELGLTAAKFEKIGFLYEASGYSNQGFFIFLATELSEGQNNPDQTETDLLHLKMSVQEFEAAVLAGKITDAPTLSAYGLLKIAKII